MDGETKVLSRNVFHCHFVYCKSHIDWSGIKPLLQKPGFYVGAVRVGLCGWESGTGIGFSASMSVFLCKLLSHQHLCAYLSTVSAV